MQRDILQTNLNRMVRLVGFRVGIVYRLAESVEGKTRFRYLPSLSHFLRFILCKTLLCALRFPLREGFIRKGFSINRLAVLRLMASVTVWTVTL